MDYCGSAGIPHSHFLGGPPVWSDADRDKALAWQERKRSTHDRCGTRREEWDPSEGGDRQAFEYVPDVCPGCEALERTEAVMSGPEWQGQRGKTIKIRRRSTDDMTERGTR